MEKDEVAKFWNSISTLQLFRFNLFSYPITVSLQLILFHPSVSVLSPNFNKIVATTRSQSLHRAGSLLLIIAINATFYSWTPSDSIAAYSMSICYLSNIPGVSIVGQYWDRAVGAATGKNKSKFVRRPSYRVHWWIVTRVFINFSPLAKFLPDYYFPKSQRLV